MSIDENEWFVEPAETEGTLFGLKIRKRLHRETSRYQTIEVYETDKFGRLLTIDGYVMLTGRDNFLYHEMIVHPALFTHAGPKRIVIIGGGDCGSLTEALKHEGVERVQQIEIDERVTRVSQEYFPELTVGVNDPRASLQFTDGIEWMKHAPENSADVIIVDSTDPVGPAEGLFNSVFYTECYRVLAQGGILAHQSESPILHLDLIRSMRKEMEKSGFSALRTLQFPQPVYPSGWWSVTLGRKNANLDGFREAAAERRRFRTRYYSVATHKGALALPPFVLERIEAD